ncbi:MAG: AAA family ATPase, partial [Planctomycetales bacterium]|nr:AAA family ATPase [Planctomycetales bacterium]
MTIQDIVILTDDPQLQGELQTAAEGLGERQPRLRFAADHHDLLQALRSKPPGLVLAPFGDTPADVGRLAKELSGGTPPIPLAAIFRPNGFRDDVSESSVLIEAMRAGTRDFLRRPISTTELRTLLDNLEAMNGRDVRSESTTFGRVITFISNKGGVGKSTLAANTAVGLAQRHPNRVLLIDGSLQMGVAAALLDAKPQSTLSDAAAERDRLDVTMIRQIATQTQYGVHLLAAPRDAVEAMAVDDTLISRIITLARRTYDFVIVDTFPMFDRVVVATLDLSDRAYVVVENVVPTLLGAVTLLDVLERIGFPSERQKLIINRSQRIAGSLAIPDIETRMNRPVDHVLPFDKQVVAAANQGEPIAARSLSFGFGGFVRPLRRLVDEVASLRRNET